MDADQSESVYEKARRDHETFPSRTRSIRSFVFTAFIARGIGGLQEVRTYALYMQTVLRALHLGRISLQYIPRLFNVQVYQQEPVKPRHADAQISLKAECRILQNAG